MEIKIADHPGFCFGVKRAINIAEKTLDSKYRENIYSLGPIIHNPQVVNRLSKKGLNVIEDIDNIKRGTVIISSHGVPEDLTKRIKRNKMRLIDATCPFVKYAQNIVKDLKRQGYRIVIVGDKEHPEVKGLLSFAGDSGTRRNPGLGSAEDVEIKELKGKKIGIISQTTQSKDNYLREIMKVLKEDFSEARIFNTICSDTSRRQLLARRLLEECDIMIIVGGKNSANTKRLWQICKESGVDSYHIETEKELERNWFAKKRCVGIVSGASTPDSMVKKVANRIKEISSNG